MTRCPETCKLKKSQLENDNGKLRRELMLSEETKQNLEKQNRIYEHEVRTQFDFKTLHTFPTLM